MTPYNLNYQSKVHAIIWWDEISPLDEHVPSTAPGYMKGLCYGADRTVALRRARLLYGSPPRHRGGRLALVVALQPR